MRGHRDPAGPAPQLERGSLSGAEELAAQAEEVPHSCQGSPRAHPTPSPISSALFLLTPEGLRVVTPESPQVRHQHRCPFQGPFLSPSRFWGWKYPNNPLQYSCLGNSHGQRSLAGCSPKSEGTTRMGTDTPVHRPETPAVSTQSSTRGLSDGHESQ